MDDTNASNEKKATFTVRIMFRRNQTWQGEICWAEGSCTERFRSAYEMSHLMDSALNADDPGTIRRASRRKKHDVNDEEVKRSEIGRNMYINKMSPEAASNAYGISICAAREYLRLYKKTVENSNRRKDSRKDRNNDSGD